MLECGDIVILNNNNKRDKVIFIGVTNQGTIITIISNNCNIDIENIDITDTKNIHLAGFELKNFNVNKIKPMNRVSIIKNWFLKYCIVNKRTLNIEKYVLEDFDLFECNPKVGLLYYRRDNTGYINLGYHWIMFISYDIMKDFDGTIEYLDNYVYESYDGRYVSSIEISKTTILTNVEYINLEITKKYYKGFKLDLKTESKIKSLVNSKKERRKRMLNYLNKM